MTDLGFYSLDKGSIGKVYFNLQIEDKAPEEQRENILNQGMSKHVHKMLLDMVHNPGAAINPAHIYDYARKDTAKEYDSLFVGPRRHSMVLQINNKNSYEEILKVEQLPNFLGWDDSIFISNFKKSYLNSTT